MTQDEINALLAEALDRAETRLNEQEEVIGLLVDRLEAMAYRVEGAVAEAQNARLHYSEHRKKLGLSVDLSGMQKIKDDKLMSETDKIFANLTMGD